jgi:hypothetical protein
MRGSTRKGADELDARGALALTDPEPRPCMVCAEPGEELICATCRARIQGEAIERKRADERGPLS